MSTHDLEEETLLRYQGLRVVFVGISYIAKADRRISAFGRLGSIGSVLHKRCRSKEEVKSTLVRNGQTRFSSGCNFPAFGLLEAVNVDWTNVIINY